jgi:L-threonylcarbamoyladenylate synthase
MAAPASIDNGLLDEAARLLRRGALVAFPTETVYGLGADATNGTAVAAVFEAKGRPHFNPLIVHLADADAAADLVRMDRRAEDLAAAFWPGPPSMVLPRRPGCPVSLLASAGLDTLAVRVPDAPMARALIAAAGVPVAAPSANRSGEVSPTTAAHVRESLGDRVALVLDGGPCRVGIESTVIDLTRTPAMVLRPGGVTIEQLEDVLGQVDQDCRVDAMARHTGEAVGPQFLRSPGLLLSHYAPRLPVRLNATAPRPDEALLGFGPDAPADSDTVCNLSPAGNLREAAANLFAMLRRLDTADRAAIAVMAIPDQGLGRAINDRLRRAAAPRPDTAPAKGN